MTNVTLKIKLLPAMIGLGLASLAPLASAHIGVVNTQPAFAIAGSRNYQLVLAIPHGCETTVNGTTTELDTYKFEMAVPTGFTNVRPIIDGVFGRPVITRNSTGAVTTLVWTKAAGFASPTDDQSYRIIVQGAPPNAPFSTLQFNVKQYCKNPTEGSPDIITDWANYKGSDGSISNQSPKVKVYPARVPGWNKYNLATGNEKANAADVKTFLTDFFADAQIVWVGKAGYSANAITAAKIKALAAKDATYFDLSTKTDATIKATDDIMVKY